MEVEWGGTAGQMIRRECASERLISTEWILWDLRESYAGGGIER